MSRLKHINHDSQQAKQITWMLLILFNLDIVDINECDNGLANCSIDAVCDNTDGAFDCTCNSGFTDTLGDGTQCDGKFKFIPFSVYLITNGIGWHSVYEKYKLSYINLTSIF